MRVAIAGAGDVGQSIAQALLESGHRVLLIERKRAAFHPPLVPEAEWMFADACELATLQSAGIEMCDVVIAAAGDDKVNLVFAMLCKSEFSVARVVARINNPDNRWMFTEAWGVDVAVSTPSAVVSAVEEQVSSGKVVRLVDLQQQGRTSIVEITVPADSAAGGTPIGRLELPSGAALLAVLRGRDVLTGAPDEPLLPGDEVVLVAAVEVEEQLRAVFAPVPSQAAAD